MILMKSKLLLVLLVVAIGWLGLSLIKTKLQKDIVNKEVVELEVEIADLENENLQLEDLVGRSSDVFLEKEARTKLNYKAPDEQVAFVYPDESAKRSSTSDDKSLDARIENSPNYVKWWHWLIEN